MPCYFLKSIHKKYDIYEYRHGISILKYDFPKEFEQLEDLLKSFYITEKEILSPGGSKSLISKKLDNYLYKRDWEEKTWDINIKIDSNVKESPTHQVDYYKNRVAVELEWNNKDPFFDRDLNNFRLLHQLDVISVGVIVTRTKELQNVFNRLGKGKSYGTSTTHIGKLLPKIDGGGAAECPLIIIGISPNAIIDSK